MKSKARVALVLVMLLVLASVFTAEAASSSGTASISVGSWSYCKLSGTGQEVIRANDVKVSGLRRYTSSFWVDDLTKVAVSASGRKTVTLQWIVDPAAFGAAVPGPTVDTVWHRVQVVADTTSWTFAAVSQMFYFQPGQYTTDCAGLP